MSCYYGCTSWKDLALRLFVTLMVSGIIGGGLLSLNNGSWWTFTWFICGLACVPIYLMILKGWIKWG